MSGDGIDLTRCWSFAGINLRSLCRAGAPGRWRFIVSCLQIHWLTLPSIEPDPAAAIFLSNVTPLEQELCRFLRT